MREALYNPILPINFAPLLKSTEENGTHRIVARGGRYSGKTTTVIEDAIDGWITIPGAIIGAVFSLVTTAINYNNAARKIEMEASLENISLGLANVRAGGNVAATSGSRNG